MTWADALLDFARTVGRLKALPRQGWVDRNVSNPESVADHTYRAVMLAWTLGHAAGLDTDRLVKMMLVHDLAEARVGDATPYAALLDSNGGSEAVWRWRELLSAEQLAAAKREKHARELAALDAIVGELPGALAAELRELALDYVDRGSAEGQFAAQIDKIEALLQAIEYLEAGQQSDVESFLTSVRDEVTHPVLVAFVEALSTQAKLAPGSGPRLPST